MSSMSEAMQVGNTGLAREDVLDFAKLILVLSGSRDEAIEAAGKLIKSPGGTVDGVRIVIGKSVGDIAGAVVQEIKERQGGTAKAAE